MLHYKHGVYSAEYIVICMYIRVFRISIFVLFKLFVVRCILYYIPTCIIICAVPFKFKILLQYDLVHDHGSHIIIIILVTSCLWYATILLGIIIIIVILYEWTSNNFVLFSKNSAKSLYTFCVCRYINRTVSAGDIIICSGLSIYANLLIHRRTPLYNIFILSIFQTFPERFDLSPSFFSFHFLALTTSGR